MFAVGSTLLLSSILALSVGASVPVWEVTVRASDPARCCLVVESLPDRPIPRNSRLLIAVGSQPVGLLSWHAETGERVTFVAPARTVLPPRPEHLRAWVIRPDAVMLLRDDWPSAGELSARLDCVGPAARSAWVGAGRNCGIRRGDSWWLRNHGQPIARLDVRLVEANLSFCSVIPLASELRLARGQEVLLWPGPGRRLRGQARSAVAFVETQGDERTVWVAAPRNVACPPTPWIEFYRDGQHVGAGIAERTDERFWYIRPVLVADDGLRVGDEAVIRTNSDIVERRFRARIFEVTPEGYLITAGDSDRLAAGEVGTVARDGQELGQVVVRRVQRSYTVVRPAAATPHVELQVGDQVRFGPPPAEAATVATIDGVVAGNLFTARLTSAASAPPLTPLAVRVGSKTIGVALIVAVDGRQGMGFVCERSLTGPLSVGAKLIREHPPTR